MKQKIACLLAVMSSVGLVTCMLFMIGCSTPWPAGGKTVAPDKSSVASVPPAHKGGAEVWAQNCAHCHNIRSPSSYSDAQWEVVMLHMRVRANLTAEEHKKILTFLKSAH